MSTLTPPEHEHSAAVETAAMWLSEQPDDLPNKMHELQQRFGLTAGQAAQALTVARQYKVNRRAFG
ncbi:hypothetical protein NOJ05_13670 [Neorhizobium galegae]|uniref:hypothetical protein n=1 Tax=Neorhizobium galegae TaxID=399 RepID=UPI0021081ADE|nr:hypothetical protein [Neorhizobium galegae]MCQ1778251.1 hypothetical protein [Neorhizobium galegae]MCQ1796775.1 hypothetical protein [Neorhizobium galegae]